MRRHQISFSFFVIVVLSFVPSFGCATTGKLMKLSLQMTKDDVISAIGKPTAVRGSMTNKHDQVIEVWEYAMMLCMGAQPFTGYSFTMAS